MKCVEIALVGRGTSGETLSVQRPRPDKKPPWEVLAQGILEDSMLGRANHYPLCFGTIQTHALW